MTKQEVMYKVKSMRRWYVGYQVSAGFLFAAAFTVALGTLLFFLLSCSVTWLWVVLLIAFILYIIYTRPWRINEYSILNFLDRHYPELEESGNLLLKSDDELNLLERLQQTKIREQFAAIPVQQKQFLKPLKQAALILISVALVCFVLIKVVPHDLHQIGFTGLHQSGTKNTPIEKLLPQIAAVEVSMSPPAYTGKPTRTQDKLTIDAEEGAVVSWKISTNIPVKQLALLFNYKERVSLTALNHDRIVWGARKKISQPGFYQVSIDGKLSDLYQVQVIKDQPPVVRIKTPKPYTYIDAGEAQKINIDAAVTDDYGINNALIVATVAKGSGEAVKFKEYKLDFSTSFNGHSPQYNLQKLINLPSLNMEPGDELYFYIQATDTHQQQSRTDVYTVSIQDTAQLLSMDGILTGTDQKPEFFRSERQIILDAEKLLKDKDSISTEKFKSRSNDLGTDQKLLRLRYGKFLGEESENDMGGNENDAVSDINNYGNADVIKDKYTDKHDNAEDADFFDPLLKNQLKATLTEMWKAELQLRLYKPQNALPFAYKALRLLKDLQQKSRLYVAKTAFNPPPLKLEKRLSGDLTKVNQPIIKQNIKPGVDQLVSLRKAVEILEQLKSGGGLSSKDLQVLALTNQQLSLQASAEPRIYLAALSAMRRILSDRSNIKPDDITRVEKAIQKTLTPAKRMPVAMQNPVDMGLSQEYYKNLNQLNR
ncbi:protein of unknown function [Mucilaginibacter sp. OK268]|uniref:DUF4175 family protein n=1 Tax=Mucilaginibacter sp. OK268 TaxID=1881048 RepID=UPI00088826F5|nr:DUF4175 family protein [Mucilaginibacter sp. OK268]SDP96787.1 protein of unknown function [Mucilaginibacter sp. OK268]